MPPASPQRSLAFYRAAGTANSRYANRLLTVRKDEAAQAALRKARQVIAEQGDAMFG